MNRSSHRVLPWVAIIGLALSGCFGASDTPERTVEPTADPTASAAASASAAPTAVPTAEPTEAPASAEPSFGGGGQLSVTPNPDADALFTVRDVCQNRQDGYELEYPEVWYTNTATGRFPPCVWFSPTFYEVTDQTSVPDEIAIEIFWVPGDYGWTTEILSREEGLVGSQRAIRVEVRGTADDQTDGTSYVYVIQLGPSSEEGPNLVARTDTDMGGDYELSRAVLDRIMATIEFIGTTQ